MKEKIEEFIEDLFTIDHESHYRFKSLYGFTFVFRETIFEFHGKISSAEIRPVGIIYEENDEFYFAPLDEIDKIEPIVKEFIDFALK